MRFLQIKNDYINIDFISKITLSTKEVYECHEGDYDPKWCNCKKEEEHQSKQTITKATWQWLYILNAEGDSDGYRFGTEEERQEVLNQLKELR